MAGQKKEATPDDEGVVCEELKPQKVRVLAGGHVIEADPPAPTPPEVVRNEVTGQVVDGSVDAGASGWSIEEG